MKKFRGYIASRPFGGNFTPQRVQNLVIRTYAQTKNIQFLLSATEYYMDECFMMLKAVVKEELPLIDGVIMYSLSMLPKSDQLRSVIIQQFISSGKELHFALEDLKISQKSDVQLIEDIIMTKELVSSSRDKAMDVGKEEQNRFCKQQLQVQLK